MAHKGELTPKQALFVAAYLANGLNATKAAISAGYSPKNADTEGARLLVNVKIRSRIDEKHGKRLEKFEITADRVLEEIARMAFYDPADIAGVVMGCPADIASLPESVRRGIVGWGWDKNGNFTLKLAPKTAALDQLGRHLKLFTDKVEVTEFSLADRISKARQRTSK